MKACKINNFNSKKLDPYKNLKHKTFNIFISYLTFFDISFQGKYNHKCVRNMSIMLHTKTRSFAKGGGGGNGALPP